MGGKRSGFPANERETRMGSALEDRHLEVLTTANSRLKRAPNTSLWEAMQNEAREKAQQEPILGSYFHATILNHKSFQSALSFRIASRLDTPMLPTMMIRDVIEEALNDSPSILTAAEIDILATYTRDPACDDVSTPFLFFKGFHALQAHRIAQLAVASRPPGTRALLPEPDQRNARRRHPPRRANRFGNHARSRHRHRRR